MISKGKALGYTVLCVSIALVFLPTQLYGCAAPFGVMALLFGAVACFKYQRDARIIARYAEEQLLVSDRLPVPPPMTSKGSSRLFVPPPLQDRNR